MREQWAIRLALLSALVVLIGAAAFAAVRNADDTATPAVVTGPPETAAAPHANDEGKIARGREVYDSLDCSSCHAIAGQGSPRSPLDGVGAQLSRDEIREWVIGGDSIAEDLSPRALRAKRGYRDLDPAELDAMISYLASLTD